MAGEASPSFKPRSLSRSKSRRRIDGDAFGSKGASSSSSTCGEVWLRYEAVTSPSLKKDVLSAPSARGVLRRLLGWLPLRLPWLLLRSFLDDVVGCSAASSMSNVLSYSSSWSHLPLALLSPAIWRLLRTAAAILPASTTELPCVNSLPVSGRHSDALFAWPLAVVEREDGLASVRGALAALCPRMSFSSRSSSSRSSSAIRMSAADSRIIPLVTFLLAWGSTGVPSSICRPGIKEATMRR
mmetsp:Transcript_59055/g.103821  ORF Transcript_59055/g.103821 Transcript_59055/m.103821 type:complete len:241 (-) Transcript_59055:579-1301(-)